MNDIRSSSSKKPTDMQTLRGSTLGQMHYGDNQVRVQHPFLTFVLRVVTFLNMGSWLALFFSFRVKNMFPPHDAPFMSAIGWYFFFGAAMCFFGGLVYAYGRKIEVDAITKALMNNRAYAWHSQHGTLSKAGAEGVSAVPHQGATPVSAAVGAGARQYRTAMMILIGALIIWIFGAAAVVTNLM